MYLRFRLGPLQSISCLVSFSVHLLDMPLDPQLLNSASTVRCISTVRNLKSLEVDLATFEWLAPRA